MSDAAANGRIGIIDGIFPLSLTSSFLHSIFSCFSLSYRLSSQRFVPSEFGIDPARMGSALEPGKVSFDGKMTVRKAVEATGIRFTYISAGCFAGYFAGGLCQMDRVFPSKERVTILGSGEVKGIPSLVDIPSEEREK